MPRIGIPDHEYKERVGRAVAILLESSVPAVAQCGGAEPRAFSVCSTIP